MEALHLTNYPYAGSTRMLNLKNKSFHDESFSQQSNLNFLEFIFSQSKLIIAVRKFKSWTSSLLSLTTQKTSQWQLFCKKFKNVFCSWFTLTKCFEVISANKCRSQVHARRRGLVFHDIPRVFRLEIIFAPFLNWHIIGSKKGKAFE